MTTKKEEILKKIKTAVESTEPKATLILYGSYARGDNSKHSDFDILVLVDNDNLSRSDQKRIKYPLYDIEFDTGAIISPIILSKKEWETKRKSTPFFEKIVKEGKIL